MGAFDEYSATARCPRCGDVHWIHGQTKFFVPDFFGHFSRWFRPGVPQPLDFSPDELARQRVWDGSWWRVREPGDPATLLLLADFDDLFGCACGACFAVVLRFRLAAGEGATGTATLEEIALLDALADERAVEVDFADGEHLAPWTGDHRAFDAAIAALAAAPPAQRAARVREALARRFAPVEPAPTEPRPWWTEVAGPMRCESCGDERERVLWTSLTHPEFDESFFGPGWTGGVLRVGARVPGDFAWLADDVDRGYYARVRHPVTAAGFSVMSGPESWGCRCGAGRASVVLRFTRDAGGATLSSAILRAVRGRADIADIDFIHSASCSRAPRREPLNRWRPASREEAIHTILHGEWRLPADPRERRGR